MKEGGTIDLAVLVLTAVSALTGGECRDFSDYCGLAKTLDLCFIPRYQTHCCQTCAEKHQLTSVAPTTNRTVEPADAKAGKKKKKNKMKKTKSKTTTVKPVKKRRSNTTTTMTTSAPRN